MFLRASYERSRDERGAVLIYIAISLVGLLGFSALVVDYGVMWAARRQAQNAADAGALAGAISLAYVDPADQDRAKAAAAATARKNLVWGLAPNVDPATDVIIGPCPPNSPGLPDTCVRVNVFRNQDKDPLPTYFARVLGITEQGVKAMATAQVVVGNASDCLKPWAVPDKWFENRPVEGATWNWDSTFDRYYENGPDAGQLLPTPPSLDEYMAPSSAGSGSGFRVPDDVGRLVRLKSGNPNQALTAGWFFPIDLPRLNDNSDTGGDRYRENIYSCNSIPVAIGETVWNEPGDMIGPTGQGIDDLIAQDPHATWADPDGIGGEPGHVADSCTGDVPPCAAQSPRLVAVPVFDVDAWTMQDKTSGKFQVRITNILGFFLQPRQGNEVMGVFTGFPGNLKAGSGKLDPSASFLRSVILIR